MTRRIAPEPYQYADEVGPLLPGWTWRGRLAILVAILAAWAITAALFGGGGSEQGDEDLCTPTQVAPYVVECP